MIFDFSGSDSSSGSGAAGVSLVTPPTTRGGSLAKREKFTLGPDKARKKN
jgi:hypothetical protein